MGKHSHSHSHRDYDKKRKRRRHGHSKHKRRDSSSSSSSSEGEELQWTEKIVDTNSKLQTTEGSTYKEAIDKPTITTNSINTNEETTHLNTENTEIKLIGPVINSINSSNSNDTRSLLNSDTFESIFSNNVKTKQELRDEKRKREEEDREKRRLNLELNPYFKNGGKGVPEDEEEENKPKKPKYTIGDSGSRWRMMKLRKVYEMAEEEGKPVEEIALMRYGSLEEFQEAVHEKEILDQRRSGKSSNSGNSHHHSSSAYNSTVKTGGGHFKKPMEYLEKEEKNPSEKSDSISQSSQDKNLLSIPMTTIPIPSMNSNEKPVLTKNQLNKLNSKIMKAKLMNSANLKELEEEYERELKRFEEAKNNSETKQTIVLPQFNSEGRLQDIGKIDPNAIQQYNKKKPKKEKFETHDEQGNRIRYYKNDDKLTLHDLMVQEKMSNNKDFDKEMAMRISRDAVFSSDLDYLDENAERLSKRKERTEEQKRKVSINDYKRYQEALDKCYYCYNQDKTPSVPVVSLGNKVYLALPNVIEMVPGHCLIVPMNHVLTTLECEDDVWDEIRNFMKCLIQMFAEEDRAVIFMETVINLRKQRHTVIECIPVSYDDYDDSPAYFKDAIQKESEEWSQHRKIIDTSKNGFRRSMVKDLPYFHVWFDPNKGLGHVIENEEFPTWFGKEVIAGMMDLPANLWRRPKHISSKHNKSRIEAFKKKWDKYDWTKMLD
ncbi:hypothetical protein BCR36DRAFT_585421 [Piromyces finnis]|uniref:Uncharacterized protein n=1 Tax=Piromyces finnis TaxID=1754191 RepID=A0A1Y1V3X5_9FUNG|nr:hypothetical protein BCR36DRAFT_585421 [Piromyces finnis]|eukprot:ORX45951.1 hypothetical protein BCR36DRAFT_585421 [Piromyces finnis]